MLALRAALVLFVGLVAYAALAKASAATRRGVLVAALVASLGVPIVALFGPSWRVEAPAAVVGVFAHESPLEGVAITGTAPVMTREAQLVAPPPENHIDLAAIALAIWITGALALLARSIASQVRAWRLVRASERVDRDVRISDDIDSPCVVFSTVLLPREAEGWTPERMRLVLVHELAHVERHDALAQLVADVACALHWFDPLVWIVAARLRVERELAADDAVLATGIRPSHYAEELLTLAGAGTSGALAMAERTTLGTRIVAILAPKRARGGLAARGTALLVGGTLAIGAAIACASPERATTPSRPKPTDAHAQRAAEEILAGLTKKWSAESAVIVVLDAATGEVLADAGRAAAIVPGSTLKPIAIAAALETGAITPNQMFECGPEPRHYGTDALRDASPNGTLDVAHLLAVSSNIGTSHIFDALGGDRLATWLARFHFTDGMIPAKIETGTFAGANVAMGEAMTATPLQLASAYAAIAADGVYHAPASTTGERIMSSKTAGEVMAMLDTSVEDPSATGKLARVAGLHVAGKTGTADVDHHTYASFVGIADLPKRRVVILVGVETRREGASGGAVAAPAFAQLVGKLR